MCVCERECVCVCERERVCVRACVSVCVCARSRHSPILRGRFPQPHSGLSNKMSITDIL